MAAPMMKPVRNALELERVSTNKQDLDRQTGDLEENREEHNLNPMKRIRVKESGEKVLWTEEFAEVVADIKRPEFDVLSVSAVDRMARPQDMISFGIFQVFIDYKKAIVSKREGVIEPWTDQGRRILQQALFQAGNELSDLKDRLKSNRKKLHKKNRMCNPPTTLYGVVYVNKYHTAKGENPYLKPDPEPSSVPGLSKQEVICMVFNWRYLNRMKPSQIQRKLNAEGILTAGRWGKDGEWIPPGLWSRTTVIQMLKNRHYIGEHWEGKMMIPCPLIAFIDRHVFDGVQEMFKEERRRVGRFATKHLLCSFLKCKFCKRNYTTGTGSRRKPNYHCGNYDYKAHKQICRANSQVHCDVIDSYVFGKIWAFLTQPELLLRNAREWYDSRPKPEGFAALERELAELAMQIKKTQDMVRKSRMDEDEGGLLIDQDNARIKEIKRSMAESGEVMDLPPAHVIQASWREIATGPMPTRFETQRPILDKLVNFRVDYNRGEVEIEGKVPVAAVCASKCDRGIHSDNTSVQYIPFYLKERVA